MNRRGLLAGLSASTLLAACGTTRWGGRSPPPPPFPHANDVVIQAVGLVGTPYRLGGTDLERGVDCSAFIGLVYGRAVGLKLPRTVATLQAWGRPVEREAVQPGDVILFAQRSGALPTHGGIIVGGGRFVHAPSTGGKVRVDPLDLPYWARQQWIVRRASA
jgi:cell wall-associated NlpC family hydrolase